MKRKKNWPRIILVLIVIILVVFGVYKLCTRQKKAEENLGCVEILSDGTKRNTSEKLKEKYNVNGLEITNIQLIEETNGIRMFSAVAKNVVTEKIDNYMLEVELLSENGESIAKSYVSVINLNPGDTSTVNTVLEDIDISKVYSAKITKLEEAK